MVPMKKRRCTGYSLVYGGEIYVFGGYTGEKKRDRMIEKYDPIENQWQSMDFQIPQGIEASIIVPSLPNEVLIIGGTKQDGKTESVYNLNLNNLTLGSYPKMTKARCLHKGWMHLGIVWCFGGEDTDSVETFDFATYQVNGSSTWRI